MSKLVAILSDLPYGPRRKWSLTDCHLPWGSTDHTQQLTLGIMSPASLRILDTTAYGFWSTFLCCLPIFWFYLVSGTLCKHYCCPKEVSTSSDHRCYLHWCKPRTKTSAVVFLCSGTWEAGENSFTWSNSYMFASSVPSGEPGRYLPSDSIN